MGGPADTGHSTAVPAVPSAPGHTENTRLYMEGPADTGHSTAAPAVPSAPGHTEQR